MSPAQLLAALDLPESARLGRRVPKNLLTEHGARSAADKRLLTDGIEDCHWAATLKPTTIAVPEHHDAAREYLEINVLNVTVREGVKVSRLLHLVHGAVPYPLILLTGGALVSLSLAHKRWSLAAGQRSDSGSLRAAGQSEADKVVLDGEVLAVSAHGDPSGPAEDATMAAFVQALALSRQPRSNLHALYQGWVDTLIAHDAARRTGRFSIAGTAEQAQARRQALADCGRIDGDIARLRAAATQEKQIARRVALNLELKRAEGELATARQKL